MSNMTSICDQNMEEVEQREDCGLAFPHGKGNPLSLCFGRAITVQGCRLLSVSWWVSKIGWFSWFWCREANWNEIICLLLHLNVFKCGDQFQHLVVCFVTVEPRNGLCAVAYVGKKLYRALWMLSESNL